MEEQKRKKEAEKARQKKEDEDFDKQLQAERDTLERREQAEMIKEGKKVPNAEKKKVVDNTQFMTSDERAAYEERKKNEVPAGPSSFQ